jgi:hypothetical protein
VPANSFLFSNRRHFLKKSGLLAGAAMFLSPWPKVQASCVAGRTGLPLTAIEREVLQFISGYGRNYFLENGRATSKLGSGPYQFSNVVVEIADLPSFQKAWQKHPFSLVYARKNTLSLVRGDTFFAIEHLQAPEFQQRLEARANRADQLVTPEDDDAFSFLESRLALARTPTILSFRSTIA